MIFPVMFALGILIIIAHQLHFVGSGYGLFSLVLMFVLPAAYFVWNNRGDYEKIFGSLAWAIVIVGTVYIIISLAVTPFLDYTIRYGMYYGIAWHYNTVGLLGSTTLIGALYLCITAKKKYRYIAYISAVLSIIFTLMSASRASFFCIFLQILVYIVVRIKNRKRKISSDSQDHHKKKIFVILVVLLLIVVLSTIVFIGFESDSKTEISVQNVAGIGISDRVGRLIERLIPSAEGFDVNQYSSGRILLWQDAISRFNLLGNDVRTYPYALGLQNAHNFPIEFAYRTGVPSGILALILEVWTLVWVIRRCLKKGAMRDSDIFVCLAVVAIWVESMLDIIMFPFAWGISAIFFFSLAPIFERNRSGEPHRPCVSVIVPVFNAEKYLNECLDSVLTQSLSDIEVICVNDGSTDGSSEILENYSKRDRRIKIIAQENRGLGGARDTGMKYASGEYFGFVDSDDWIDKNYYSKLYRAAKRECADLARTMYQHHYPDEIASDRINETIADRIAGNKLLGINDHSVVCWNAIYRRDFLLANNIDFSAIRINEDILFTAKATILSRKSVPVSGTYYHYRRNVDNAITTQTGLQLAPVLYANHRTVEFINSIDFETPADYFAAFKRCIWRYNERFVKTLSNMEISMDERMQYFELFCEDYHSCRDLPEFQNTYWETYFIYLKENDFVGYMYHVECKVSVIIPVYNVERYLRECLDSIIAQTYDDIEIICINDDSTDESLAILEEYGAIDKRIVIVSQENIGVAGARDAGLRVAKGKYIAFVDSDDYIDKDAIKQLVDMAEMSKSDIVMFPFSVFNDANPTPIKNNGSLKMELLPPTTVFSRKNCPDRLFVLTTPNVWNKFFRRLFLTENSLEFGLLRYAEDYSFSAIALAVAERITWLDDPLYYYRQRADSLTANRVDPLQFRDAFASLYQRLNEIGVFDEIKVSYYSRLMALNYERNRAETSDDLRTFYNYLASSDAKIEIGFSLSLMRECFASDWYFDIYEDLCKEIGDTLKR
jgi:glycosyltransferase involved in cell wall biosynthesis